MKQTIYTLLIALIALCSCDLDRQPLDTLALENQFNNKNDLETFTNGFYVMFPTASDIYSETSDLIIPTTLTVEVSGTRTVPTSDGGWSWKMLSDINTYLKYSYRCSDVNVRETYDGVARFFRAYFYFEKIKRFGEVPWYDEPLKSGDESLYKPRDSRDFLMGKILEDVDYAIQHLATTKSKYRVTKWTALALKSRIFLFEGTYRKYQGLSGYENYLKEAVSASEAFIKDSPYSIYNTGSTPYRDLFAANYVLDEEVILGRNYNLGLNIVHSANQYFISGGSKPGLNKKIIDSYLMNDGSRFTDKTNYQMMQFYQETQNRDPRLSQTIVTPGYKRINDSQVLSPDFAAASTGYQIIKWVTDKSQDNYNKSYNDIILFRSAEVFLNYAEAKAELGTLTQTDIDISIKKIRDRAKMPNINMADANAKPDPYLSNSETGYANVTGANKGVILEIRRERTIELLCEGFRYYDIVRWKEGKTFEKQFKGMFISAIDPVKQFIICDLNGNGINDKLDICIYKGTTVPSSATYPELLNISVYLKLNDNIVLENDDNGGNVVVHDIRKKVRSWTENKDYLYPIPQDQITLYGGKLAQNPNW